MLDEGTAVGPSPVDRGRSGCTHPLIVDAGGVPRAGTLTGGHRHDLARLMPLVEVAPPIRGRPRRDRGAVRRPRLRPRPLPPAVAGARDHCARSACRGVAHGCGPGPQRWVVEGSFAWLHAFKRLRMCYQHCADIHLGLLQLSCYRRLRSF